MKEGNITNRIAGLVAHTSKAQSAQNDQPGSQPAKQNLEEQHTPTSKKQKRAAPLSVVIGYKSQPRTHVPTPRGGKIVHLVIRGTPSSVAKQILKHPNYSSKMVEEIGKMIKKELTTLCSENANSMLLRSNNKSDLMQFTWDQFLPEAYNHLNYWKWILVQQPDAYFRAIDPAAPICESQNEGNVMEEIDDLQCNSVDAELREELLCPNFSDSDATEPNSVTFDDSVVEAELLNSSSNNFVFDTLENDFLFDDDVDDAIAVDCSTVDAAEETELMEICNGDETDNPILVRHGDEVISEAKWNGFKLCGDNIDKTVKPRNMTISKQRVSIISILMLFLTELICLYVQNISFFKLHFEDAVEYHIKHKFTKEISTKAETNSEIFEYSFVKAIFE
uniref:Uncharacterized protein n=1 Tax=Amphimedon queenslandica TaxID=400682 RepID=A0A1X7V244_AMPQE